VLGSGAVLGAGVVEEPDAGLGGVLVAGFVLGTGVGAGVLLAGGFGFTGSPVPGFCLFFLALSSKALAFS
jgi:hypothetical protein